MCLTLNSPLNSSVPIIGTVTKYSRHNGTDRPVSMFDLTARAMSL